MARGLARGEQALIVVVSVLVLVFLGMLVSRLGGGVDGPDDGATTTASPSGSPTDGATAGPGDVVDLAGVAWTFRLPSGNVGCAMADDGVVCAIQSFDYEPPGIPGCEAETGRAFRIGPTGTTPLCTTGAADLGGAEELPYGESVSAGEFTCTSSETGVACRNALGHEITLRRAGFTL